MPTIYIAGDSLAAQKELHKKPETGWGEVLHHFLPRHYRVSNHAINGRSTKSFIAEKRLEEIDQHIQKGDFLLIQFGHNDQKIEDPLRYTNPYTDYLKNLKEMIEVAVKHQAFPILLTPVTRRAYLPQGMINSNTLGEYPNAMRTLAKTLHIPLIDVFMKSQAHLSSLKENETKELYLHLNPGDHMNYPNGLIDNTHLSEKGALWIADLIYQELQKYL